MKTTKVCVDCDPGVDDVWALITLLKCEQRCNIELKAITVCTGNTNVKNGCQNALLILKTLNRMDVPVYAGSEDSLLIKDSFVSPSHGSDGLKDVINSNEKPSLDLLQTKHAVQALHDLIEEVKFIYTFPSQQLLIKISH